MVILQNNQIKTMADKIVQALRGKGFVIQRYDAYSTSSVYLKLDYGVCNTIRISDHEGKKHLCYRYNVIFGGETNIVEEKYMRYYFNENTVVGMLNQILFDKAQKIKKYGQTGYKNFMIKNMRDHSNDKGFWKDAKLVTSDITVTVPKDRNPNNIQPVMLEQQPNGIYVVGPDKVVDVIQEAFNNQHKVDANAKFQPEEKVVVSASFDELTNYFATVNETITQAKTHAMSIKGMQGYDVGTIIGATQCDEGMFYTVELPLVAMEFLPENFLRKAGKYDVQVS